MRVACIVGRERLQSLQGASVKLLKGIKNVTKGFGTCREVVVDKFAAAIKRCAAVIE